MIRYLALMLLAAFPFLLGYGRAYADIGLSLIVALFLLHSLLLKNWAWGKQPEMKIAYVLWAYMVMRGLFLPQWDWKEIGLAAAWLRFPLFYAALRYWLLDNTETFRRIAIAYTILLGLFTLDTFVQYATGTSLTGHEYNGARLTGILSHPNIGNMLIKLSFVPAGIVLYHAMNRKKRMLALATAGWLGSLMVLLPLTGERSSTLLGLLGFAVLGIGIWRVEPSFRRGLALLFVLTSTLTVTAATNERVVYKRASLFTEQIQNFSQSPYGQLYKAGWEFTKENPVFGLGSQNQFRNQCEPQMLQKNIVNYCDLHPHNFYLEWLVAYGVIGFSLFLLMLARILLPLKNVTPHFITPFSFATLAMVLFPFIVTQSIFANWSAILFWFALSMAISAARYGELEYKEKP